MSDRCQTHKARACKTCAESPEPRRIPRSELLRENERLRALIDRDDEGALATERENGNLRARVSELEAEVASLRSAAADELCRETQAMEAGGVIDAETLAEWKRLNDAGFCLCSSADTAWDRVTALLSLVESQRADIEQLHGELDEANEAASTCCACHMTERTRTDAAEAALADARAEIARLNAQVAAWCEHGDAQGERAATAEAALADLRDKVTALADRAPEMYDGGVYRVHAVRADDLRALLDTTSAKEGE